MLLASRVVSLGFILNVWVSDLGFWVEPMLARRPGRSPRPWPGLLIILLLVLGIATASGGALWLLDAALPHREARP